MTTFGTLIRQERKKRKWTQRMLASKVSISQPAINSIENGGDVRLTYAIELAKALGLPLGNYSLSQLAENVKKARGFQNQFQAVNSDRKLLMGLRRCELEENVFLSTAKEVTRHLGMSYEIKLFGD